MNKQNTKKSALLVFTFFMYLASVQAQFLTKGVEPGSKPNVIMIMADDLGWGDVGFNGNSKVMTPQLDELCKAGVNFTHFYAAAPLCSPSRAACLTGRNPFRQGIYAAHTGGMRHAEVTIAELLKDDGYRTGIFGKWHIGWIESEKIETRGSYSPPWQHGYEESFVTKSAVPTWNPTKTPEGWTAWGAMEDGSWGGSVYLHNGEPVTENLDGDDSRIIMDRALPFIEKSITEDEPFYATIWFHTPHEPVVAGPEYLAKYPNLPLEQQHLYGCITAMDEQIARLMTVLREQGVEENTIVFFTSDNGPSGPITRRNIASAGPFKGNKHEIWEGGIRVPSVMWWKGHIVPGNCTSNTGAVDYLPTIVDLLGLKAPNKRPIDGVSLVPLLSEQQQQRDEYMAFGYKRLYKNTEMYALIDGDYKLAIPKMGKEVFLFNLATDSTEQHNLADSEKEKCEEMQRKLQKTISSWQDSDDGKDYTW